ncbi:MAG TPA: hypothetical protein VMR62_27955 [Bryobacteraceae bacterium]|nr:hypothetical protein [Bryobacteraceae bacterium]
MVKVVPGKTRLLDERQVGAAVRPIVVSVTGEQGSELSQPAVSLNLWYLLEYCRAERPFDELL